MPGRITGLTATFLFTLSLAGHAVAGDEDLYSEENLIYVIEVFDRVNAGSKFTRSCECVRIESVQEATSSKFPAPKFNVFKVRTDWLNEAGRKMYGNIHYLAHEAGTDNSTWYVHHLKFGMKPIQVP